MRRVVVCFAVLALALSCLQPATAQTNPIGLPIIFVHGWCDGPDSFIQTETAVKQVLQGNYSSLFPDMTPLPNEYVAYFDGAHVVFQELDTQFSPPLTASTVDPHTRFFFADFSDGTGSDPYTPNPDRIGVANISILYKGYGLAQIIWRIKQITGAPRVILVSHSMGGLDARTYIEALASASNTDTVSIVNANQSPYLIGYNNDIANMATLDTPHGGSLFAGISFPISGCSPQDDSTNKDEMNPSGPTSMIALLNNPSSSITQPSAITITSIASYWWNNPTDGTAGDGILDPGIPFLTINEQELAPQIGASSNPNFPSVPNEFFTVFQANPPPPPLGTTASPPDSCGSGTTVLHELECTGGQTQTFSIIDQSIYPNVVMYQDLEVSPLPSQIPLGANVQLSATTLSGGAPIWSVLEGAGAGSINAQGLYTAPSSPELAPGTYTAVAIDSGNPNHFGTAGLYVTGTDPNVTSYSAVLNGVVNTGGVSGLALFEFGLNPLFSAGSYGTTPTLSLDATTSNQTVSASTTTATPVIDTALNSGTTYYFHTKFFNNSTYRYGPVQQITTLPTPVTTDASLNITSYSATLQGTVNTGFALGDAYFEFGTSASFSAGSYGRTPVISLLIPKDTIQTISGDTTAASPASYTALLSGTTYYYHARFDNQNNAEIKFGPVASFTTLPTPVTTEFASNISSSSATLNGSVNTGGAPGVAWVEFGTDPSFSGGTYGTTSQATLDAITTTQLVSISTTTASPNYSVLRGGTLYYYRTVFSNQGNGEIKYGSVQMFRALTVPLIAVSPSGSNLITTQTLTLTVVVSGGTGNPSPTGSVVLTSGSYTSAAMNLTRGVASIIVPAGSLALGSDSLAVGYTPDASSSTVYTGASGTSSVTITAATESTVFLDQNGTFGSIGPGGTPKISPTSAGGLGSGASSVAIDSAGNIWIAGKSSVVKLDDNGNLLSGSGYTGGGIGGTGNQSTGIAADGQGYVWITNSSGNLTWLSNNGIALSPPSGFTGGGISSPTAVAVDNAGTVWVTNAGNNTVTRVFGVAAPVTTPLATGNANGSLGVRP